MKSESGQNCFSFQKKKTSAPTITVRRRRPCVAFTYSKNFFCQVWQKHFCSEFGKNARQKSTAVTFANNYWSSSTYVPNTTNAWNVNFNNGNVNNNNKTNSYYVRCVASGAWS